MLTKALKFYCHSLNDSGGWDLNPLIIFSSVELAKQSLWLNICWRDILQHIEWEVVMVASTVDIESVVDSSSFSHSLRISYRYMMYFDHIHILLTHFSSFQNSTSSTMNCLHLHFQFCFELFVISISLIKF